MTDTILLQVYSFVPIPGAQQHKRPRRRYEEIERMYKCGWNGCEKAYGTLNHLNAHVTMQSHGIKRTPEGKRMFFLHPIANSLFGLEAIISRVTRSSLRGRSSARWRPTPNLTPPPTQHKNDVSYSITDFALEFKEIRKEWKARKKEEETQRKQDEERSRAQAAASQVDGQPDQPAPGQGPTYQPGSRPQLPPIGYQSAQAGEVPSPYTGQQGGMVYQQGNGQMGQYGQYPPPHSPYGQQGQVYQQRE
jgi:transcription factor CON7